MNYYNLLVDLIAKNETLSEDFLTNLVGDLKRDNSMFNTIKFIDKINAKREKSQLSLNFTGIKIIRCDNHIFTKGKLSTNKCMKCGKEV